MVQTAIRLAQPFRLIITRSRPDARDIAFVGLGGWNKIGIRITVNFTRTEKQNTLRGRIFGMLQQILYTKNRPFNRFEWIFFVIQRRRDASGMNQKVSAQFGGKRQPDIMRNKRNIRVGNLHEEILVAAVI